jgi:nitrite reductase/ring-hydroxylating ferredoxin subunit
MQAHGMRRVCCLSESRDGGITKVSLDDAEIVIARDGATINAFAANCPHAGAPLEQGVVCHRRLVCPWHKATFALEDGAIVEPPALEHLIRHPIHADGDEVLVSPRPIDPVPPPRAQP